MLGLSLVELYYRGLSAWSKPSGAILYLSLPLIESLSTGDMDHLI